MGIAFAMLMSAIAFGVRGFEIPALWILADLLFVAWLLGFIARADQRAHWYRW
jgi:hypothetical protein